MRHVPLGLGALLLLAGCNQFQPLRGGGAQQQAVAVSREKPTAEALVRYLNDNAQRIQSLDCSELDLDAKQKAEAVSLRGWMVCQKPNNFRMGARVVGNQELDMGSNAKEFWWWIPKGDPRLFHCSYEDLSRNQVQLPFPFQPEWIMEGFGMAQYGAPENYTVNVTQNAVELIEQAKSAQGTPVRKVTVFSPTQAQGNAPQVTGHLLQDASGKTTICAAYITEVQRDPSSYAVVPKRVRLVWPQEQMELKLTLRGLTVNQAIPEQRAAKLFTRPVMANVKSYDLVRGADQPEGQTLRRTGY
jgi:hypothetical protein